MVMCAAVSVMVCYRVRETEGIGDVCCIYRYGFYRVVKKEGNVYVCCR